MKVSVITPTCDRPIGFALAEKWMRRQTFAPTQWIVVDGGKVPVDCTMNQIHLHEPRPSGPVNFCMNLLTSIQRAEGEIIVVWEDDDFVAPTHIESLVTALERPGSLLAGDDRQNYYNVAKRCFRTFHNTGASLCQTGMRRGALPVLEHVIRECLARKSYGIDTALWRTVARGQWAITGKQTCIGIKGLPGQAGLGIGHRPDGQWTPDPDLAQLRAWIGGDAEIYAGFRA